MMPGKDDDWGPRPSQGAYEAPAKPKAPSRSVPALPEAPAKSRLPRWAVWVSFALLGAILAAIAVPQLIFQRQGTPDRLKSKAQNEQRRPFNEAEHRSRGRHETEGVSVKFNLEEKRAPTAEDEPVDPLAPGY